MDLSWFTHEAFWHMLKSAIFVWGSVFLVLLLRLLGTAWQWDWVNDSRVLIGTTLVAGAYAMVSDYYAMQWCVVPWLQRVRKLQILMFPTKSFGLFFWYQLCGTALQVFTIQSNAWFMLSVSQHNDQVLDHWVYLWDHSCFGGFGGLPKSVWQELVTPASTSLVLWGLSVGQLILPLLTAMPIYLKPRNPFPIKEEAWNRNSVDIESSEDVFVPEDHYDDFDTVSSKWKALFSFRGSKKCTYRESVAKLALASGLRLTASLSISYPKQKIYDIMNFKQGYKVKHADNLEPQSQGWELRSLKEFTKLARVHLNRVQFIMLLKLALQMNLQITMFIIQGAEKNWQLKFVRDAAIAVTKGDIIPPAGCISIFSLFFTFMTELYDVWIIIRIFLSVRAQVRPKLEQVAGSGAAYAVDYFVDDLDRNIKNISYSGNELQHEYESARRTVRRMICITLISTWLIFYALLKWIMSCLCEDGAWQFGSGCLPINQITD